VESFDELNVRLIQLKDIVADRYRVTAYKKLALQSGIAVSNGTLMITTDADCIFNRDWLRTMAYAAETTQSKMVVAPVDLTSYNSLVAVFQSLDFRTMQGITAAAHRFGLGHMANGANLAFTKAAYNQINGYVGTTHIASGDDYLLLVKMAERFPNGITYLKSEAAIVSTTPQPTWKALLNQRIRWASKSGKYKDNRLTAILALVYFFNLSLFVLCVAAFFSTASMNMLLTLLVGKVLVEIIFLLPVSNFFGRRKSLIIFPFLQPLHILYICMAGFLGFMGKYEWKGRQMN
jgi:cellulose synthase/poly-beta-1,6-N-acetylglucosamine synthase-like glycosyltransferase